METVTTPANLDDKRSRERDRLLAPARRLLGAPLVVAALSGLVACKPTMVVGEFECAGDGLDGGPSSTDPITVPWQTGFENGSCDYAKVAGFCYRFPPIDFRLVDNPVHSGQYAVEISVVTGTDGGLQPQGRCVRQGILPTEAYYGAWFLIPKPVTAKPNVGLWDLFYFQNPNGDRDKTLLWDVQVIKRDDDPGPMLKLVSRFTAERVYAAIPIGRWFHLVFYLKRAKDATGAVTLYMDDQKLVELTNLITDDDPDVAAWYVGNLGSQLDPPECTVYLDDVSIRSTL